MKKKELMDKMIVDAISDAENHKIPIETCALCKIRARNGLYFCNKCRELVMRQAYKK